MYRANSFFLVYIYSVAFAIWAFMLVIGLGVGVRVLLGEGSHPAGIAIAAFFLTIAVASCFYARDVLNTCYAVRLDETGSCEFRALFHRKRVPHVSRILSLQANLDEDGDVSLQDATVLHVDGKFMLLRPRDGFAELSAHLKRLNPMIAVDEDLMDDRR